MAWALNRSEAWATEGFHRRNLRRLASLTEEAVGPSSALRASRSSCGVGEEVTHMDTTRTIDLSSLLACVCMSFYRETSHT